MKMVKSYSELIQDFKRSNKVRKQKLAEKAGFTSVESYLAHLEALRDSDIANGSAVPQKELLCKEVKGKVDKKTVLHLVDILDTSGSMSGDKIMNALQGINKGLKELSKELEYTYTFVAFSDSKNIRTVHLRKNPSEVDLIKAEASGWTALHDAVGQTLSDFEKYLIKNKNEKVLVNIYTDGCENDSKKYGEREVSNLIERLKENCTVTFIGTAFDVRSIIAKYKIEDSNTLVYDGTASGLMRGMEATNVSRQSFYSSVAKGEDVTKGFYKKLKDE